MKRMLARRGAVLVAALGRLTAFPSVAGAQTRSAPGLDAVVAIARRQNPDIRAARLRTDSAHGEQRIARALPNPLVSSAPNQPWQYTVTLPLDLTPQRVLRTRAAGRGTGAALADADDVTRQVVFAVRQAFFDVLLAERSRQTAAARRDILAQLLAADSARLRSGDLPPSDVTRAELELARAQVAETRADAEVRASRIALELLMGIATPDTAFTVSGELAYQRVDVPEDSLAAIAATARPDVRAADERVAQSEALKGLAGALWVPVPEVTFTHSTGPFGSDGLFSNGTPNAIGFAFTMPLFSWNGGERERGRAGLEQAQVAAQRVRAQVANDVATALDGYRVSRALAERYAGGLLRRAEVVLETARYAYARGAISLLELLSAIQTYADIRSDFDTAVHDYWVSVYALSRATGRELVR